LARNLRNPTCGCAAIPHFHMTLSQMTKLVAVMATPMSGADGIDRSIRITKSLLDYLGLLGSGYLGVPARVLPSTPPSPG
jgi:hypothetical protein